MIIPYQKNTNTILLFIVLVFGILFITQSQLSSDEQEVGQSTELRRYFSPILRTEQISFREGYLKFQLTNRNIIRNSEKVFKEEKLFQRDEDYQLDYELGIISFQDSLLEFDSVEIEYSIIPEDINRQFYYYISYDYCDTLQVIQTERDRFRLEFPDTQLNISGSKTISVSVASDEDFNIHQSLFLRIDGELRRNLRIRAQLSDSQSPLTPEGDTRELSSLDQIFIKLYGNEYEVSFGDLDIAFDDTQFMNYASRFEGLKAEWFGKNSFQGALAISRGKESSNEFFGKDGKQGPYFVTIPNIGTNVQIIPGSETVYLNGVTMTRGTDYTIDYSFGSFTFTSRHFIDSNSRIFIRFQYSDEDYRQNMYFNSSEIIITDKLKVSHHLIIQNDDKNNPLQETFSEIDRAILKEAGDSPAWADGVIEVEPGEGLYVKEMDGEIEYYRYVGSGENGNYVIYFSYVGQGNGNYQQIAPNNFEYVGENNGSWLPVRLLPSPQFKANYDIALSWDGEFYEVSGEGIFSNFDRNTFSPLDSFNNEGYGMHWQMRLYPDFSRIDPDWLIYYRHLSKYLETFSDIRDPQLSYDFYEITEIDTVASNEIGTSLSLNIENIFIPRVRYLRKSGGNIYNRDNLVLNTTLNQYYIFPRINYRYNYARQSQEEPTQRDLNIRQNQVNSSYIIKRFQLAGNYQYRTFRDSYYSEEDEDWETGTRYRKRGISFGTYQTRAAAFQIFADQEYNDTLNINWQGIREALTFGGEGFLDVSEQRIRTAYSHREVKDLTTGSENRFDMAEVNLNNSLLNRGVSVYSNYALKNLEFFPYVRELIYVGENVGIYDSTGVVTENGGYDYIMVQVGDPEMSVEINADLMLNITPRLFIKNEREDSSDDFVSIMKNWFSRIQSESYFQIMENSRSESKWDVYLLNPSLLMNSETTIYGRNLYRQTVWLDIVRSRVLAKGALHRDRMLDNRYQDSFRTDIKSHELMLRFSRYWATDFELTYENRLEEESRYDSKIEGNSYSVDIRNRLDNNMQLATLLIFTEEKGDRTFGGLSYRLRSYGITETFSYFFQRRYRFYARMEYRRNEREGSGFLAFLPEKREGNIFRWNFRLNYQLNPFTSGGVEYSGNNYPLQDTVHQLKVEVRAEF